MEIKRIKDVEVVVGEMHDSEFEEKDFCFDFEKKYFTLSLILRRAREKNFI